ncbi:phospholipase A1-Ibeta2, chloroplastic [Punica granatum]|uniref:Phospholipase A1-Ibeta2, chloroplastic n=1 Tax=Punica granatum TaxID=22663 RepID=A0A6P8C789_PUNGR|nr:phospholipase A1-Ibeta2, chloroplastic [Punica granatum]
MAMRTVLPGNSLSMFQARSASFKCRNMSPLNPSTAKSAVKPITATTISTRKHLSNLEKLLRNQPLLAAQEPQPANDEGSSDGLDAARAGGILHGLNLGRIWPEMKAAEEMSPRNFNRLQRLLSMTPQYSPRNDLGSRWREYHGSRDWAGLLDPLDENLRREVVRYGELIQAAYHAFHSNPEMPTDSAPGPQHVAVPDKCYKVTKSLYATSSIGLPKLVNDVAPGWMTQKSSWIGYVAVCDDKREIQRMGRRDIVIALRGTATCLEWAENMRAQLVQIPGIDDENNLKTSDNRSQPKVECGFLSLHKTQGTNVPSLAESVIEEVRRLVEMYKGESLSITVTGHSLGAALSVLVADDLSVRIPDAPPIAVFSFGGPRVGNRDFADRVTARNVKVMRIVNDQDLITRVPGVFLGEDLEQKLKDTGVMNGIFGDYCHVGTELRVDTRMSPYLKPSADMACCHDLEAYLHLVDGFSASNCPFRANAKRSLVKLLNEQRSNMKKLYTSKAKALRPLTLNLETAEGHYRQYPLPSCLPSPS